jgi:co-chaperonin GroES (HSP10)
VAPLSSNEISDPDRRPHRLILPLGLRVLVQVIRIEERTDAGLYLPQGAKEANDDALYGKVIEVARDRPTSDDLAENVSGVPHGANVLFRKEAGVRVPWDDRYRLIDVKDILATVEEVMVDEAH